MDRNDTFDATLAGLQEQIAAWKKQYKRVYLLRPKGFATAKAVRDIPFILRHPERFEMARMIREHSKDALGAMQNLVLDIALHPDRATLGALCEEMPMLAAELQVGIKEHLGADMDFTAQVL